MEQQAEAQAEKAADDQAAEAKPKPKKLTAAERVERSERLQERKKTAAAKKAAKKAKRAAKRAAKDKKAKAAKAAKAAKKATAAKATAKPAGDPIAESKKYLGQGVKAYKAGNFQDAAKYFRKARAKDKANAVAARYLKMAEGKLGK
jgi:hypothetical protein